MYKLYSIPLFIVYLYLFDSFLDLPPFPLPLLSGFLRLGGMDRAPVVLSYPRVHNQLINPVVLGPRVHNQLINQFSVSQLP